MGEVKLNDRLYKNTKLKGLLKNGEADCTFIMVNGEKIKAHKLLLACNSPVFEKMFFGLLSSNEVEVKDLDVDDFKQMLEFIYTDNVALSSMQNAWNLYAIAHRYLLDNLAMFCVSYIEQNLSIKTLGLSYELSDLYGVESLMETCWKDMILFTKGIIWYETDYHIKLSTLCRLLEESFTLNDNDILHAIAVWTINECRVQGIEVSEKNIIEMIDHLKLMRYVNKSEVDISAFDENGSFVNSLIMKCIENVKCDRVKDKYDIYEKKDMCKKRLSFSLKERRLYKIATKLTLYGNDQIPSVFMSKCKVALFGVMINAERAPGDTCSAYTAINTVSIIGKNINCKNLGKYIGYAEYESVVYVPFDHIVVLNPDELYNITVTYKNPDFNSSSIILNHFSQDIVNKRNETVFTFFDTYGSVVRTLCYYPI